MNGSGVEQQRAERLQAERRQEELSRAREQNRQARSAEGQGLAAELRQDVDCSRDTHVFTIAMVLAAAKDASDLGLTLITAGGAPVLGTLFGWALVLLNWWFLTGNGWFKESQAQLRFLYWALGFFVDNLPLVSALPINTLIVLYAWSDIQQKAGISSKKLTELEQALRA